MKAFWCVLSIGLILGSVAVVTPGEGSPLVHKFINPNFGGSPFNGQPLLNSAILQNDFKEDKKGGSSRVPKSQLETFEDRLNRSILSRLSREIVDGIFGEEEGFPTGSYDTGDFNINITEDLDGVIIVITNQGTGESTTINVPFN